MVPTDFGVVLPVALLGVIVGLGYGMLAAGLVLVYRTSRILNFAQAQMGAVAVALLWAAVERWNVPYWPALLAAVTGAGVLGAATAAGPIRRLARAPAVVGTIATLGVTEVLLAISSLLVIAVPRGASFPEPPGVPDLVLGGLTIAPRQVLALAVGPAAVGGIVWLLYRHRWGLWMRASAADTPLARAAGVPADVMVSVAWAVAGSLAALTMLLSTPPEPGQLGAGFGILLRALIAAVIARMDRLATAVLAGLGIGILEQGLFYLYPVGGMSEILAFGILVTTLVLQRSQPYRGGPRSEWLRVWSLRPLSADLASTSLGRALRWGAVLLIAGVLAALLLVASPTTASGITAVAAFAIVGLSVGVLTGLSGRLSLAQVAFAGVGSLASIAVTSRTGNFPLGFVAAGLLAAATATIVALPTVRHRAAELSVATLSFALVAHAWVFRAPWAFGEGVLSGQPIIGGFAFDTGRRYAIVAVAVLAVSLAFARTVWRGGVRRRLIAVRDHEAAARAFGISPANTRILASSLSGFLAGVGGALLAHGLVLVTADTFAVDSNVDAVAVSTVGGLGWLFGPLLGSLYVTGIPRYLGAGAAVLGATAFGWLLLLLVLPGGMGQLARPLRNALERRLRRSPKSRSDAKVTRGGGVSSETVAGSPIEVHAVSKSFGQVLALDGVSLRAAPGEIVALVGPNGAGKTTLIDVLAGTASAEAGKVLVGDLDITSWSSDRRARWGLARSFEDAVLFPTLTVLESVQLAFESRRPHPLLRPLLRPSRFERSSIEDARSLLRAFGLDGVRDLRAGELSSGQRRIAELACMVARAPRVLLLDEPSSGLAQGELEGLGRVLRQVRKTTTMIIAEHNMELVAQVADRIAILERGRLVSEDLPMAQG